MLGAVLMVRLKDPLSEEELHELRRSLITAVGLDEDDFWCGVPFQEVTKDRLPRNAPPGFWFDVGLIDQYYGPGYERGDIEQVTRCAEWIKAQFPNADVWYGHDVDPDSIQPFDLGRKT